MKVKRKVILVTDGDEYARRAVERAARELGGRCISSSGGNPTILSGPEIIRRILETPYDPVLVMFDDSGFLGEGAGERAMKYVASCEDIEILGILAVASKTHQAEWAKVDISIDRYGELTHFGVDKHGFPENDIGRINGDTVYCVDQLKAPIVVGIGDIGKMSKHDDYKNGSPITKMAIELILERSGFNGREGNR